MAIPRGNRSKHLQRARELIDSGSAGDLQYAALELRLCLEAMTYDKLSSFGKYLPKSLLERTWQPPQLLKAMMQLDGNADQSFKLFMGEQVTPGVPAPAEKMQLVGEHKAFGVAWLRKHYNKLGSMLHLQPSGVTSDDERRNALVAIAGEIEEAQKGSILGMWMGETISFDCDLCGQRSTVSSHYARTTKSAYCMNPDCELEYAAHLEGNEIILSPRSVTAPCRACGHENRLRPSDLKDGMRFTCPACKREHLIRCQWSYAMLVPGGSQAPPGDPPAD